MRTSSVANYVLAVCAPLLVAACAAPIRSNPSSPDQSFEGIRYSLSKTTVRVDIPVRIAGCDTSPTLELLPPSVLTPSSADDGATYVVNPRDAVNLFRTITVPALKLTSDGRLAKADSKAVDTTVPTLLAIAKAAAGDAAAIAAKGLNYDELGLRRGTIRAITPPALPPLGLPQCTTETADAFNLWKSIRDTLASLQNSRLSILKDANRYDKNSAARISAMADAEAKLSMALAAAEAKITRTLTLELDADGQTAKKALDLTYGWLTDVNGFGCDSSVYSDPMPEKPTQPLCMHVTAKLVSSKSASKVDTQSAARDGAYNGLLYRVAGGGLITVNAEVYSTPTASALLAARQASAAVRPQRNTWISIAGSAGYQLAMSRPVSVLQFGVIARLPSDVGMLTSNNISAEFDADGVPNSLSWSVEPLPLAGLLGLPAQIVGLRPAPSPAPSAISQAQADLLAKLVQSCIDALASGSAAPSYCVNVLK